MRALVERWIIQAAWFKDSEGNLLADRPADYDELTAQSPEERARISAWR